MILHTKDTDGGRMSISLFGRGFSRIIRGLVVFLMVLAGLFGGDECNVLLFYAVFATIWQKEPVSVHLVVFSLWNAKCFEYLTLFFCVLLLYDE